MLTIWAKYVSGSFGKQLRGRFYVLFWAGGGGGWEDNWDHSQSYAVRFSRGKVKVPELAAFRRKIWFNPAGVMQIELTHIQLLHATPLCTFHKPGSAPAHKLTLELSS